MGRSLDQVVFSISAYLKHYKWLIDSSGECHAIGVFAVCAPRVDIVTNCIVIKVLRIIVKYTVPHCIIVKKNIRNIPYYRIAKQKYTCKSTKKKKKK